MLQQTIPFSINVSIAKAMRNGLAKLIITVKQTPVNPILYFITSVSVHDLD